MKVIGIELQYAFENLLYGSKSISKKTADKGIMKNIIAYHSEIGYKKGSFPRLLDGWNPC